MVEDDQGTAATTSYCDFWKQTNSVEAEVILDAKAHMWNYVGKEPGIGVIIDRQTMQIVSVTTGGDWDVYGQLLELYNN